MPINNPDGLVLKSRNQGEKSFKGVLVKSYYIMHQTRLEENENFLEDLKAFSVTFLDENIFLSHYSMGFNTYKSFFIKVEFSVYIYSVKNDVSFICKF